MKDAVTQAESELSGSAPAAQKRAELAEGLAQRPPTGIIPFGINVGAGHGHGTATGASHPLMAALKLSFTRARSVRFAPHLLLSCNCILGRATFVLDEQVEPFMSEEPGRMLKSIKPGY